MGRLLQFPEDMEYSFVDYHDVDEDIVSTRFVMEKSSKKRGREIGNNDKNKAPKGVVLHTAPEVVNDAPLRAESTKTALKMCFTLPAGAYATMMFREMTRASTDTGYQAQLTAMAAVGTRIEPNERRKLRVFTRTLTRTRTRH